MDTTTLDFNTLTLLVALAPAKQVASWGRCATA